MNRLLQDKGRVLAFGAHPDDLEVGAGGLLARLSDEGAQVTMVVVSIPGQTEKRRAEAHAGAEIIDAICSSCTTRSRAASRTSRCTSSSAAWIRWSATCARIW